MALTISDHYKLFDEKGNNRLTLASLYHDMFREVPEKKLITHAETISIPLLEEEKKWPSLLHAPVAAHHASAHECLGADDIVSAIRWHTLASPDMGLMGAILYCADYMELERNYMDKKKVKKLLSAGDIEHLLKRVLEDHFEHSEKKKRDVAGTTFDTYRFIIDGGTFR